VGILVVLLVAAWGLVLGPAVLQSVGATAPVQTERMFRRAMRAMGRRQGPSMLGARSILVPRKPDYPAGTVDTVGGRPIRPLRPTAAERRRKNLTYLAIFIISTFVMGLIPGLRFLLVINVIADVLLVLYLGAAFYLAVWPPASERDLPPIEETVPPQAAGNSY
jgi:hypothetical protein